MGDNDVTVVDKPGELRKRKRFPLVDLNTNVDFLDRVKRNDTPIESSSTDKRHCLLRGDSNSSNCSIKREFDSDSSRIVTEYSSSDKVSDVAAWLNVEAESSVYSDDIFDNMMIWEKGCSADPKYLQKHPKLSAVLRSDAVIWLVESADKMGYHPTTLFRAVSYLDRYLSRVRGVGFEEFKLAVTTSLLLAAKMEETETPGLTTMACLTPGKTTVEHLRLTERRMAFVLDYRLSLPTGFTFLMHILTGFSQSAPTVFLALYILELCVVQGPPYIGVKPSLIASASLALARSCMEIADAWSDHLVGLTGYNASTIHPVTIHLYKSLTDAPSLYPDIAEKYSSEAFLCVATVASHKLCRVK